MIKTESLTVNGKEFIKTYSDRNLMIERDGIQYSEAVDLASLNRTYTETDTPIEQTHDDLEADELTKQKAQAYDIIVGGDG